MSKILLAIATVLTIGVFAGAASACPYSGHASEEIKKPVVIGS